MPEQDGERRGRDAGDPAGLGQVGGPGRGEAGEEQARDEDGGTTAHTVARWRKGPWIRQQSPPRGNPRGVDGPL